jgi:hypothetical protein
MISQQTASVNNDAMVIAASAVCLLAALELCRPTPERWHRLTFWTAFAVGIAVLAKSFGAAMAPVVFLGWLIGRWRTPKAQRLRLRREIGAAAAGVLVTYGAWSVIATLTGFRASTLGDFGSSTAPTSLRDYLHTLRLEHFKLIRVTLVDQFWGDFGWVRAPLPGGLRTVIGCTLLLGSALVAAWVVREIVTMAGMHRRRDWTGWSLDGVAAGLLMVGTVVAVLVLLYGIEFEIFRSTGGLYILQGRYFLAAIPAVFALPALAVHRLWPRVSFASATVVMAAAMVALNTVSAAIVVEHFYL